MLRGLALATVHVSTATTTTSGYSKEVVKNKQGSLDCLQQTGVQPASAKRHFVTETTGAEKDSATVTETEDVKMCDVSKVSAQGDTVIRDTDKGFVRAMVSAQERRSLPVQALQHPSTGTIGPAWSLGTFQPPAQCQHCVLEVASQMLGTYRNITPSLLGCHSTDYAGPFCYGLLGPLYELQDAAGSGRVAGRGQGLRDG